MYSASPYSHDPYTVAPANNAGVLAVSQVVTAEQGDVTVRFTYQMTGQAITVTLGNETVRYTYRLLGTEISVGQGLLTVNTAYKLGGNVINSQMGQIGTLFGSIVYPVSNVMTVEVASPVVETRYFVDGLEVDVRLGNEWIWSPVEDSAGTIWVPVIVE